MRKIWFDPLKVEALGRGEGGGFRERGRGRWVGAKCPPWRGVLGLLHLFTAIIE